MHPFSSDIPEVWRAWLAEKLSLRAGNVGLFLHEDATTRSVEQLLLALRLVFFVDGRIYHVVEQDVAVKLPSGVSPARMEACLEGWRGVVEQVFIDCDPERRIFYPHELVQPISRALTLKRRSTAEQFALSFAAKSYLGHLLLASP